MALVTIGYAAYKQSNFLERLRELGIEVVADVRAVAGSRKPGFAKGPLARRLAEAGVEYVDFRELGAERDLREFIRRSGDYEEFFRRYRESITGQEAALRHIESLARVKRIALLCLESDARHCHRWALSELLRERDASIQLEHAS